MNTRRARCGGSAVTTVGAGVQGGAAEVCAWAVTHGGGAEGCAWAVAQGGGVSADWVSAVAHGGRSAVPACSPAPVPARACSPASGRAPACSPASGRAGSAGTEVWVSAADHGGAVPVSPELQAARPLSSLGSCSAPESEL
ncbi:hypothetical protein [Streptomyces sp. SID13726]|uniref:hypothetical protein n=1 Tax=Streptomyces sp. SID13726 TaxID=2706058 RepID=UPI001EF1EE40|nr:hypothetical protein [Streptomyces sp. SID13726]